MKLQVDNNYTVNGITYDVEPRTIVVDVVDNGDGTLKIEKTGADTTKLDFVNLLFQYLKS